MRRTNIVAWIVLVMLGIVGYVSATAVGSTKAVQHTGAVAITCERVTFSIASFPAGKSTVTYSATVNGHVTSGTHDVTGPADSFTVPLNLSGGAHYTVSAIESWTVDGGGSASGSAELVCGSSHTTTTTTTTTTPQPPLSPPPPPRKIDIPVCPSGTTMGGLTGGVLTCIKTVTVARTVVKYRTRYTVKYRTRVVTKWRRAACHCPVGTELRLVRGHYRCGVPGNG